MPPSPPPPPPVHPMLGGQQARYDPVSSMYIWSEKSRPKREIDFQCQSCFDVNVKMSTVILRTDNLC